MKQCPQCRTTYTDESLRFCLADGTPLEKLPESVTTAFPGRTEPIRIDVPPTQAARYPTSPQQQPPPASSSKWLKIFLGVAAAAVLGLGLIAVIGVLVYVGSSRHEAAADDNKGATPTVAPSPTVDREKQKLQDELANLQKRLQEQKKNGSVPSTTSQPADKQSETGLKHAAVNSPNDGFLALRSLPDENFGDRIAKIPHGATVDVIGCADETVSIAGRTGHWCLVTYKSAAGFAFDGFLDYQ